MSCRSPLIAVRSPALELATLGHPTLSVRAFAALGVAVIGACAQEPEGGAGPSGPMVRALRESGPFHVPWSVRFSFETAPCPTPDSIEAYLARCPGPGASPNGTLSPLAARAAETLRQKVDADALRASTLIDVIVGGAGANSLDRAVFRLDQAARLTPRSAAAHADLSAVLLIQASVRKDPLLLLRALDVASQAVILDSLSRAARYNEALALELLALDRGAEVAWQSYLTFDSTSLWGVEARTGLQRVRDIARPPALESTAPAESLKSLAARFPAEARGMAWERLLGEWGTAIEGGDEMTAAHRLAAVETIGQTLSERFSDETLARAAGHLRALPHADARQLASRHMAYAGALRLTRESAHVAADSVYSRLLVDPVAGESLRLVATYAHANALSYAGRTAEAIRVAQGLLARTTSREDPALVGRTRWLLGIIKLRLGENDAGMREMELARMAFAQAGERENLGAVVGVAGEVAKRIGDDIRGFVRVHESLHMLRAYPAGTWRHNVLFILAGMSARAGLPRATAAIEREDVAATSQSGLPVNVAEATLERARSRMREGNVKAAALVLDSARRLIAKLPDAARTQIGAEASLARAELLGEPRQARSVLDSVAVTIGSSNSQKLARTLVARAKVHLATRNDTAAEDDLTRAAALYDASRRATENLAERASLVSSARDVFDRLVATRLRNGRTADALRALEQGRVAFSSGGVRDAEPITELEAPHAGVAVSYAVIGDSVIAWVIDRNELSVTSTQVPRTLLVDAVNRTRAGLELRVSDDAVRADLSRLFGWLIAPIFHRIGNATGPLVIIADRELGDVPFAALYDAARARYLIEVHDVRYAGTLREASVPSSPPGRAARALLVAAGADASTFPGLEPLVAADSEVTVIAGLYQVPVVIRGSEADPSRVRSALGSASLLHFAGHAVFDDVRPDRSMLVLGRHALTSDTITSIDLRHLRLVVLSACETSRVTERRGSGMSGLAEAFLAAGAGGVVGSLWRVGDASTSVLMHAFHASYAKTGDAAASLRAAQLRLLRSSSPAERSPSAWGAFRYVGF